MKKLIVKTLLPLWYKLCCMKRVKNKVLFVEIRGNKISSNYSTIIAYLKNVFIAKGKKIDIQTHFLKLGSCTKFSYFLNCFKLMPKIASARYVFIDDCSNVIASLKLRKKTKVIQTWHACGALKKFGLDTGGKGYYGNEDVVCLSTPNIIPCYQHAMGLPADRFYPIGVPRSDVFFQETYMENCKKLREKLLQGRNKRIILFAPTYRGNVEAAKPAVGLNMDLMYKHLGQEYIVLTKFHDAIKKDKNKVHYRYKDFVYDISGNWSIEEAMGVCDILITDYSSLIFEYSILNKPAIFYACDLDEYIEERDFYIDYQKEMPGEICTSTMEVIKEIKNGYYDAERMRQFRKKYMTSCDGHATKRLVDMLFGE